MLRGNTYRLLVLGLLIFTASGSLFSQDGEKKKKKEELKLKLQSAVFLQQSTDSALMAEYFLSFPNLQNPKYYKDAKLLKQIRHAEKAEDVELLDSLLEKYISNFTIANFQPDIEMIWRAGQVNEQLNDTSQAMLYYEIGVNHQRPMYGRMKTRFDSLNAQWKSEWVDLDFYHKLLEARRKIDPLIPPKGVMLNMGPKINSDFPEYAPFMHPSDSVLIFTSRRNEDIIIDDLYGEQNEDLYFVLKDFVDGNWTFSERFEDSINSPYNEGSACLSRDGRTLFFTRCNSEDGMGNCDIYISHYVGSRWTRVRNLGENINSAYWDSHPNLSPDGRVLFFASNRKGGFGGSDLYMSVLGDDGKFGPAINLGPRINSLENEVTPFFHAINQTLYFSSRGHLMNVGGFDIFKSRWLGTHWQAPKNLGPLVNTQGNEYYFSIDGKGTRLFYATSREKDKDELLQNFDLFSFPMPMEARPDAITTLKGVLIDSITGNPLRGVVLVLDKDQGIEIAPKKINKYGYFEFDLINDHHYEIYVQGENYFAVKDEFNLAKDTMFSVFTESFAYDKPFVFETIQFEDDSHELTASIEPKLDYIAAFLEKYPMFNLKISGHTDSDGEADYNAELSEKRALKIRKYIHHKGKIENERVEAKGYGESRPLVPNDTEEHKKLNRRVEFEIFINPQYQGDLFLPTDEEIEELEEDLYDPEFMKGWEEEYEEDAANWNEDDFEIDENVEIELGDDEEEDKELLQIEQAELDDIE